MAEISPLSDGLLRIHKIISRAINVSIIKCDEYLDKKSIPLREEKGFMLYMMTFVRVMHAHHLGEDDIVFPYFTGRLDAPYNRLKDDHILLAGMLGNLEILLKKSPAVAIADIKTVMTDIRNLWEPHISAEEISFAPANLAWLEMKEQLDLIDKIGRHSQKASGPGPLTIPFVLYNLEKEDRAVFLDEFPWIIKRFLVPVVWRRQWKAMDPFLLN